MDMPATYFDAYMDKVMPDNGYLDIIADIEILKAYANMDSGKMEPVRTADSYDGRFYNALEFFEERLDVEFKKDTGLANEVINPRDMDWFKDATNEFASDYFTILNFMLFGKKTFYISDNLSEHMAYTEVRASSDMLQMPFSSFQMVFSSKHAIDAFYKLAGDEAPEVPDYTTPVSVFVTKHNGQQWNCNELVVTAYKTQKGDAPNLYFHRSLCLKDGWNLEDTLLTDWDLLSSNDIKKPNKNTKRTESACNDGLHFYRIILNSILYISSEGAEKDPCISRRITLLNQLEKVKSSSKLKKKVRLAQQYSQLNFQGIGTSIKAIVLNPRQSTQEIDEHTSNVRVLKSRGLVRGHWKSQAYGEQRSLRKTIRIEPYYKGHELAEQINSPYIVK